MITWSRVVFLQHVLCYRFLLPCTIPVSQGSVLLLSERFALIQNYSSSSWQCLLCWLDPFYYLPGYSSGVFFPLAVLFSAFPLSPVVFLFVIVHILNKRRWHAIKTQGTTLLWLGGFFWAEGIWFWVRRGSLEFSSGQGCLILQPGREVLQPDQTWVAMWNSSVMT